MKLSLIFYYVLLTLDSITIIEAITREKQIEQAAWAIPRLPFSHEFVLRSKLRTEGDIEYWEGYLKNIQQEFLVRVAAGELQGGTAFDNEIVLFDIFDKDQVLRDIVARYIFYAPNIAVTSLDLITPIYKNKAENTFVTVHEIGVSMASQVIICEVLHRYGYTGNGKISDAGFTIDYSQEGIFALKLSNLFYVVKLSDNGNTKLDQQKKDLMQLAKVLKKLSEAVKLFKFFLWPIISNISERFAFLRKISQYKVVVKNLHEITLQTYDTLRNIFLDPFSDF